MSTSPPADTALPVWSKPDPAVAPAAMSSQAASATLSSSRFRPGTGNRSKGASPLQVSSAPTSGSSTPSVDHVQLYSQHLYQQLAAQQHHQLPSNFDPSPSPPRSDSTAAAAAGSGPHTRLNSPPQSSGSSPSTSTPVQSYLHPQVLETNKLKLQTHLSTGKRMVNQYIIEGELGRGVHGKVRLARDTETGDTVAVKIVERESRKKLGGGSGGLAFQARFDRQRSDRVDPDPDPDPDPTIPPADYGFPPTTPGDLKGKTKVASSGADNNQATDDDKDNDNQLPPFSPSTRFAPLPSVPRSPAASIRLGRWADSGPSRPTYADKEAEKQRLKDREKARKALLWTTDQKVRREIAIMKKCSHENVVRLREVIDDPHSKKIFMVLEYMEGGEIIWKDELGRPTLTVEESRQTLRDVVCGLEYLHYQGIIHRDIKPANLLWDRDRRRVKISDFGVSHFSYAMMRANDQSADTEQGDGGASSNPSLSDDHELAKTAGSPAFFAPELCMSGDSGASAATSVTPSLSRHSQVNAKEFPFSHQNEQGSTPPQIMASTGKRPPITKAIDVWALGVTLFCLLFGHTPFTAESEFALFAVIPSTDYALPTFMGADRVRIGPRKPRWQSPTQWVDEEADAQPETPTDLVPDARDEEISQDASQLRDLLDRLLEKDPSKRISLEQVKKHPWVTQGLQDAPAWLSETDPAHHPFVEVSHADVEGALTGFSKLKQRVKQWQSRLFVSLGGGASRKRSSSVSQLSTVPMNSGGASSSSSRSSSRRDVYESEQSSPRVASGGSAPASSSVRTPRTPLLGKPHYFFSRKASSASMNKGIGSQGEKPLGFSQIISGSVRRKNTAADGTSLSSAPHSRPVSPLGHGGDAVSMLRQISGAPAAVSTSQLETGGALRPPIVQRRSSSRSSNTGLSVARPEIPQRKSSDTQSKLSAAEESLHSLVQQQHSQFAIPAPPLKKSQQAHSPDLDPHSQRTSRAARGNIHGRDGQDGPQLRISTDSEDRSSLASVSQSSKASHRHRLGSFLRRSWLQQGEDGGRRRLGSRGGRLVVDHDAAKSSSSTGGTPRLTVDALGAAEQLGPRQQVDVPISAPLPSLESRGREGSNIHSPSSSDQLSFGGFSPQFGPYAVASQPSSPHAAMSMTFSSIHDHELGGQSRPRMIDLEHDDVDLDLELSDDDFDEDTRHCTGPVLSNDGSGWLYRQDSEFVPEMMRHKGSNVSSQEVLTPSVEGGYNVFKPPYRHILSHPSSSSNSEKRVHGSSAVSTLPTFELDADLSSEAEALRRAELSELRTEQGLQGMPELTRSPSGSVPSRSSSQKSQSQSQEVSRSQSRAASRMEALPEGQVVSDCEGDVVARHPGGDSGVVLGAGDVTGTSDDQFADADEQSTQGAGKEDSSVARMSALTLGGDHDDDEGDSDDMCVSFEARKKSSRVLQGSLRGKRA